MPAARRPIPSLSKAPMWVPTVRGRPRFAQGLYALRKEAVESLVLLYHEWGIDGEEDDFGARRVWIALEGRT